MFLDITFITFLEKTLPQLKVSLKQMYLSKRLIHKVAC